VKKYTKKPVEVEALQFFDEDSIEEIKNHPDIKYHADINKVSIQTLEGLMWASRGDYIIRGINGELYPCKPDIFDKTYEK